MSVRFGSVSLGPDHPDVLQVPQRPSDRDSDWVRRLDLPAEAGWVELVEEGPRLGRALAATYAPVEDALYVLDEVDRPRGRSGRLARFARLLRLTERHGATHAEVAGEWQRRTPSDRFALATGPDGSLYVASSGARGASAVLRLRREADGALRGSGFSIRARPLASEGLRVGPRGVTLVLDDPREGAIPVGIGYEELRPGRGGEARCF